MRLHRCFAWDESAAPQSRGGALWLPRILQGGGRHDRPDRYGCLYLSLEPVSTVVERIEYLRGTSLGARELIKGSLPLAIAEVELADTALIVDLDDPSVLSRERLRPSLVATRDRARTQAIAAKLFNRHPAAAGLRWWSTFEARWTNVTLWDRGSGLVMLVSVEPLTLSHEVVIEAARFLGLRIER